jgi:hypothetical protein
MPVFIGPQGDGAGRVLFGPLLPLGRRQRLS